MKRCILFLCFISSLSIVAQFKVKAPLIPREVLFKGEQKHSFKLAPAGDIVYYRIGQLNKVFAKPLYDKAPAVPYTIPSGLKTWDALENGLLLSYGKKLILRNYAGTLNEIELPEGSEDIRVEKRIDKYITVSATVKGKREWFSLKEGELKPLPIENVPANISPLFDKKLQPAGGTRPNALGGNDIMQFDPYTKEWSTLLNHPFTEDFFLGGFSKALSASYNGEWLYYTSNLNTDKTQLYRYNRFTCLTDTLASHPKVDLLPFGYSWDKDGNITSIVGLYAKTERVVVDAKVDRHFKYLNEKLRGDVSFLDATDDGKKWIVRTLTGGPSKFYLYQLENQNLTYLFNDFDDLEYYKPAQRKAFEITTRDSLKLPIHIYLPPGSDNDGNGLPDRPLPTVIYVHGGPWVGIVQWNQYFHWRNFQLLANRGYCVINMEFRGSTGMGKNKKG